MTDQPPETPPSTPDDGFEARFAVALGEAHERARNSWKTVQAWNEWVAGNALMLEEYLRRIGR